MTAAAVTQHPINEIVDRLLALESEPRLHTPEVSALISDLSGYNPVVTRAEALTSDVFKKNFQEAYPGDALKKLWHRPPEPTWFAGMRKQYVDRFESA